ncbi:MAG: hypothetical protein LBL50_02480 [Candidatus Margulisbacteria bacterium]|jgi:hypothetical protein|nr:hypothetical protein [Candidatus Margulisiibacteriota bacterium]
MNINWQKLFISLTILALGLTLAGCGKTASGGGSSGGGGNSYQRTSDTVETIDELLNALNNVDDVIISGNITITDNVTIPAGKTLTIGEGATLNVDEGATLTRGSSGQIKGKGVTFIKDAYTLRWLDMSIFSAGADIIAFCNSFPNPASGGKPPEDSPYVSNTDAAKPSLVGLFNMSGGGAILEYYTSNNIPWNGSVAANKWWLLWSGEVKGTNANSTFDEGTYTLKFGGWNGSTATYFVSCVFTVTSGQLSSYTLSYIN